MRRMKSCFLHGFVRRVGFSLAFDERKKKASDEALYFFEACPRPPPFQKEISG